MTDLDKAIATVKRVTGTGGAWDGWDFWTGGFECAEPTDFNRAEATIINAAASGELIPKADPGDDAGLVKELREFGHYPALRQAAADRIEALIAERDTLTARVQELEGTMGDILRLDPDVMDVKGQLVDAQNMARAALAKKEAKE